MFLIVLSSKATTFMPKWNNITIKLGSVYLIDRLVGVWMQDWARSFWSNRINFIDENDTRSTGLGDTEQISDPSGPLTYKHFVKLRTRRVKKWDASLTSDGSSEEGFSRAWRADKETALG